MPAIDNYISLQITLVQPGITTDGFGTPLILSAGASFSERTREYSDLDGMVDDGFATSSPEYRAASAMLAQSPHVPSWKVGRLALPPTMVYVVSVEVVRDNHVYQVNVEGEGVTTTEAVTTASDGSADNDEIVALLVTALNNVVGNNYTAAATGAPGSQVVTVTADNPGDWFSLEVDPDLSIKATHVDPGYATDLAAIKTEDPDWYVIYNPYNSDAVIAAIAGWAESNKRAFWADTNQTECVTEALGGGDPIDDLNTQGYKYSMGIYHPNPADFLGAAWIGRYFCTLPGKATAALKQLSGVAPVALTDTQRGNLTDKRGNSYEQGPGARVTFNGTVPSTTYLFFDVVRNVDAWSADLQASGFGVLAANDIVQMTDDDFPKIEAALRGANKRAEAQPNSPNTFARGTTFVTVPKRADVPDADAANRFLSGVKAGGTLAGAVHKVGVIATISF